MPTLNWIGKEAVVKHHKDVPFRLLEPVVELSCGDNHGKGSGNLIVQGDNLHALKALLPRYAGQVKCIYIDPPYNTGNEGWVYNDNVNSPEIRKWLGEVVGKEGETLDRHDRWLSMMYPRLVLLKQFLREDGAIFVSIDDNEVGNLRPLMDEIFGARNFITAFIWRKVDSPNDNKVPLTPDHEYVLAYARSKDRLKLAQMSAPGIVEAYGQVNDQGRRYRDRLLKKNGRNSLRRDRPTMYFPLTAPDGGEVYPVHDNGEEARWAMGRDGVARHLAAGTLIWKQRQRQGRTVWEPYTREYAPDDPRRPYPSIWADLPTMRQAKAFLRDVFNTADLFDTPKPVELIERILRMMNDPTALVLDSFAGSGTTGHAVLKQNAEDGGTRRFLLVEMEDEIAGRVTAERVRKVAEGYTPDGSEPVAGIDGGFQFCRLSIEPLFDAFGQIRSDVRFAQLAEFVWFAETGTGYTGQADSPLLGVHEGRAIYLLYNGILKDKSVAGGNVLTGPVLDVLPKFDGPKVIYAAANRLGARAAREGITFKQTPYALEV
ncbi:TPA: site-specific DNA-methyltransferase [Pseudomonas aeruginosa]|uniref:site-specific DNA-methyltransferase n=1 Tax=Pseudomonas aeruginosa TaxID=287 RepID=UPI000FC427A4|nr:site-specific DNA-methyltransferase [Pseudomonas aeruginosa]MCO3576644.1 site-specific DNA-methyltransferase [Pseudomonas aeruginosa]MCO3818127.1 site-specific DNA-methyltransferase [Pseudomonas aeruginosa]RUF21513.1 site-specific DNA-methyltransferase [Pseudomonas aeruginosa]HBP5584191.1 site-specific DNA-methyltransferase [Pseudomonas aeruginosa]